MKGRSISHHHFPLFLPESRRRKVSVNHRKQYLYKAATCSFFEANRLIEISLIEVRRTVFKAEREIRSKEYFSRLTG